MEVDAQGGTGGGGGGGSYGLAGSGKGNMSSSWVAGAADDDLTPFFTPSYLRHSRPVQMIRRAHEESLAALQEQARLNPPKQHLQLSANSSTVSVGKLHASHSHHHRHLQRPAVRDVVERLPPPAAEGAKSGLLPSRWNEDDKMTGLEILAEGTEVRFGGVTRTSDEAASIRADRPMLKEWGLYYFEVTILSRGKDGLIGIGFSQTTANLNRLPGWEADSFAYHGDDGFAFAGTSSGKAYGPRFSSNDVIGCGVNFRTGNAFFTKNGVYLGTAFTGIKGHHFYPSVGMKKPGEHLRVNFGRHPFVYDIDRMMDEERQTIKEAINKADVTNLHPPDDEHTLIHKLVGQYLAHEGYLDTAKAFARDVHERQQTLSSAPQPFHSPDADDDVHATNRQKIRKSILDGDIDRALKYTGSYYPHVLEDERNRDVHFRLRCRKFIEMMRRYADLVTATSPSMTKSIDSLASNGHGTPTTTAQAEQPDSQMELDEQLHREASANPPPPPQDDVDMDASAELPPPPPPKASFMKQGDLLTGALAYGQELQHEFGSDPRPQVKKQLQDLFAIIAYPNPADSPIAPLLDPRARVQIAEEVNGAILGKSCQQACL